MIVQTDRYPEAPSAKWGIIAAVERGLEALGARPTTVRVFRQLAGSTDPADWQDGKRPICFREQGRMAAELNISDRHFRRLEAELEAYGAIRRETTDNGYRGRRSGPEGTAPIIVGISLAPCIEHIDKFRRIVADAERQRRERDRLVYRAGVLRHRLRADIASGSCAVAEDMRVRLAACETRMPRHLWRRSDIEALTSLVLELEIIADQLRAPRSPDDPPLDHSQSNAQPPAMSGASDTDGLPQYRITDEKIIEPCKRDPEPADQDLASPASPTDARVEMLAQTGFGSRREGWGWLQTSKATAFGIDALRDLASDDFALYLDGIGDPYRAALAYLRELGITRTTWQCAESQMGRHVAVLALAVIDRNRFHPTMPVRNPAAVLRGLIGAHRLGRLDLQRSINAIRTRELSGRQPRRSGA